MLFKPLKSITLAACSAITLCAGASPSHAASVVYRYSSNDFTTIIQGSCLSLSKRATMNITMKKPIAANFTGTIKPVAWTASDGVNTYTNATIGSIPRGTPAEEFEVWTDASGNIVNWYVYVESTLAASHGVIWAVLSNNMPAPNNGGNNAQAVDAFCGGFAESSDLGLWITPH